MATHDLHVIYDDNGRILAVADATEVTGPGGVTLRHEPHLRPGQNTARFTLEETHEASGPAALLVEFEVDATASEPILRRRGG